MIRIQSHIGYHRFFALFIMLSLVFTGFASSQTVFQEKILSYLRNPILLYDDSLLTYLAENSLLSVSDDATQPTQDTYTLNITNPVFSYTQGKLHDNDSTVTEGYNLRFTVNDSMPNGEDKTVWMRLPKNLTLTNYSMGVAGLMSSASADLQSKVYSVALAEITSAYAEKEIVAGTDSGQLIIASSGGVVLSSLTKTFDYPIYSVATAELTSATKEDYVLGLANGTVLAYQFNGNEIWRYSPGTYPIYSVDAGNVTKGAFDDVVIGTWDDKLILLNSSGDHVWNLTVGNEIHDIAIGNVTADDGNEIVVASYDGKVYVLNRTGSHVWNYTAGGWVMGVAVGDFNTSSPGNEVIYMSNDFSIYVLNSSGDGVIFSFPTGSYAQAAAVGDVLQDSGNELVAGSWDKIAYIINTSGENSANRTTGGFIYDVEIGDVFTEEGLEVVVASGDGNIYMMNFRFFTKDPYIDIAGSGAPYEWNFSGIFRATESLNTSFLSLVQSRLNLCNTTLCDVAFLGHSNESGVLSITPTVSFDLNASAIVNYTTVPTGFSKTEYINVNEKVGTEIINITYLSRPDINISITYIAAGATATECDFNSDDYLVTTASGQKACDITSAGRILPSSALYDMPSSDVYWDDSMNWIIPAIMTEENATYTSGTWRKNITITNGSSNFFRNIIANTTVNDSLAAQELRVDWYNNGTYFDITPPITRADCNTSSPTYTGMTVGAELFYVCKMDVDGDQFADYFKWIQPYINKTTNYYAAAYLDEIPTLTNVNVTPQSAPWGTLFNYSTTVADQENQVVEVILSISLRGGNYFEAGRTNVTGTGIAWFNLTSNESWTGTNNSFYFSYTDHTHPWYYTQNYSLPNVTGHTITYENVTGNNTIVERKGLNTTQLSVTLRDEQLNETVGAGTNCSFWVRKNGVYGGPYTTTADANGVCSYGFDPDNTFSPGHRKWMVEVTGNVRYAEQNSTEYYVNITGEANLSFTSSNGRFVRGQSMILQSNLIDEFSQDAEISSATCRWYLNDNFRGTSATNNTGHCTRTETTDCNTWNLGPYNLNVTLDPPGNPFWTVLVNESNGQVTLTDLLTLAMNSPANASIIHKGDTVELTSTALPSVCVFAHDPNQISWYLSDTEVASTEDANWTIPIVTTVGEKNLSVNATQNYSSTPVTRLVYVYGYSAVQSISPTTGNYVRGTPVTFTCRIIDANLSSGIENYTVSFYKDETLVNSTETDALGDASWQWNTTNESESVYNITCMIWNASHLYYTASPTNQKEASVTVTFRMSVLNITFNNQTIYRNDSFTPNTVNITAMVGKGASVPTPGATLHVYLPGNESANCTTDAQGYCSVTYNPPDNTTPNNYSIYLNATKTGELESFTEETSIIVKGILNMSIASPTAGDTAHRGDSKPISSNVIDENGNTVTTAVVKWNDSTDLLAQGEDTIWSVSSNQTLGNTTLYAIATKSYFDSSIDNTSIVVWGWAEPMWVSPKFEMSYGVATYLVCNVTDSNSTEGVANYPVSFYYNDTLIGSNSTTGTGQASIIFTASEQSTHVFKCVIGNASDLYYNASKAESDEEFVLVYPLRTFQGRVVNALGGGTNLTFRLYAVGTDEIISDFTTASDGSYNVYVHNKTSDLVMTLNEIAASVKVENVDFKTIINDPIDFDLVSGTETTLVNDVRGFALNTTFFTGAAQITMNYTEVDIVESEDYLSIYYCQDWNYTSRVCLGEWIQLKDSVVNKPLNTVSVNVTNLTPTGKTAYMIAENLPYERIPRIGFVNATPTFIESRQNITLLVSVSDIDLDQVNATLGNLTVTLVYNSSTGLYEYLNLTSPPSEGEYTLTITVADQSGNIVTDTNTTILVDDSNPIIRLVSPQEGVAFRAGTIINLSVTDASLDYVILSLDYGANATFESPYDVDTAGWLQGLHIIDLWAQDKAGHLQAKTYYVSVNNTILAFTISGVNAKSIQVGETTIIEVNVSSGYPITSVTARVTYPGGSVINYTMTNDTLTRYSTSITGLTERGDYLVQVTATNSQGTTSSATWFELYVLREFYGDVLNALNQPVDARFRLLRPGTSDVLHDFSTDANGEYALWVRNRTVDMEVTAEDTKAILKNVNFSTLVNDPIDIDLVEGSDIYVVGSNALRGIALSLAASFGGNITFMFDDDAITTENETKIFECTSWDYTTRICNVDWTEVSAKEDIVENTLDANVSTFTTYALTEQLRCGNGVCEAALGENCFVCEPDCGPCDIMGNITVQARRPPAVDLDPIEETLANHSETLDQLQKDLKEFRAGVNLSALESRIREQFLTVEDISTILSMSRRAQALVPGLQIVSAELYPGESIRTSIHVKNVLNDTSLVYLNVTGRISAFLSFEKPIIELEGYGEDDVGVLLFIPLDTQPAAYYGELKIISGDVVANIPVNLRVLESREKILDLKIQVIGEEIAPGEQLRVEASIYNLGGRAKIEGELTIQFVDIQTNDVLFERTDNVTVETTVSVVKALNITGNVPEGRYVVRGKVSYVDQGGNVQQVSSIGYVTVRKSFFQLTFLGVPVWLILFTVFTLTTVYVVYFLRKRQIERRRRYLEAITLKALPQPGPRSGFVGRIAETDIRAFMEIDKG